MRKHAPGTFFDAKATERMLLIPIPWGHWRWRPSCGRVPPDSWLAFAYTWVFEWGPVVVAWRRR